MYVNINRELAVAIIEIGDFLGLYSIRNSGINLCNVIFKSIEVSCILTKLCDKLFVGEVFEVYSVNVLVNEVYVLLERILVEDLSEVDSFKESDYIVKFKIHKHRVSIVGILGNCGKHLILEVFGNCSGFASLKNGCGKYSGHLHVKEDFAVSGNAEINVVYDNLRRAVNVLICILVNNKAHIEVAGTELGYNLKVVREEHLLGRHL